MADQEKDTDLASAIKAIADAVEEEEGPLTAKKRRIIEAAVVCFADQGYQATSTSQIAKQAGVAEATIFRHFNTKKELLIRLVRPVTGRMLVPAAIEELWGIKKETGSSFRGIAEAVMLSRVAFIDRYEPLFRIIAQELPFSPELRELLFTDSLQQGFGVLMGTLSELTAVGDIRADIPPARLFRWFGSLLVGYVLLRSLLPPGTFDDKAEIAATVDFMIRGAGGDES